MKIGHKLLPFVGFALFLGLGLWLAQMLFAPTQLSLEWSELKASVVRGEVEEVVFRGDQVTSRLKGESEVWRRSFVVSTDESFVPLLEELGVINAVPSQSCRGGMYAILVLPLLVMVLFWVFVFNRESGGVGLQPFLGPRPMWSRKMGRV